MLSLPPIMSLSARSPSSQSWHPHCQITVGLNDLAKSVAERNEIIATSGRNRQAVKLNMENQKKMDVLKDQWNLMKKLVDKEKRKGKGVRCASGVMPSLGRPTLAFEITTLPIDVRH